MVNKAQEIGRKGNNPLPSKEDNWIIRKEMELLTTSEMAKKWDISRRRVTTLCAQGRIEGAILKGNTWLIPENAEKPDDPRRVRKNVQNK